MILHVNELKGDVNRKCVSFAKNQLLKLINLLQYVVQYVIRGVAKYGNLYLNKCVNNLDLS